MMEYIEVKNESKKYKMGETEIIANNQISFSVKKGELALILGPSGYYRYRKRNLSILYVKRNR